MTVIILRGTSGSGKTHAVRSLIDSWEPPTKLSKHIEARGKLTEMGYLWEDRKTVVLGRYDATCGGCDTMSWSGAADDACDMIRYYAAREYHVILEGLMVSTWGFPRYAALAKDTPLIVLQLTTPLNDCIASVQARRDARGVTKPFNPDNTVSKYKGIARSVDRMRALGVTIKLVNRQEAADQLRALTSETAVAPHPPPPEVPATEPATP